MKFGKFYGIGVGPGDPELLTIKAVKILQSSDVIYVPTKSTVDKSFAYSIIQKYVKNPIVKPAIFPMSYNEEKLKNGRKKIVKDIVEDLKKYEIVSFITIGDPVIYSTYSYIVELLKKEIPDGLINTIPGISSINMIGAKSNTPLALEDEVLTIYPLTFFDKENFKNIYNCSNSIVLMKIPKNSKEIFDEIKNYKFSKVVYMKNICKDGELMRFDLYEKELYKDVKKYFTIILLKK